MISKTVQVVKPQKYGYLRTLQTTWRFMGIPFFVSRVVNP